MDFIIEIFNPVYAKNKNALKYDFKLLSKATIFVDLSKENWKCNIIHKS